METEEERMNAMFEQTQLAGQVGQQAQASASAQYYMQEQEKNLAETQLDVETIISTIYHLIKQDISVPNEDGRMEWQPLKDQTQRALTDWGVDRIIQVVRFYVNKNTLLSNFDETQINRLMLRFCLELNDLILLKYEYIFRQPSFDECKAILKGRLEEHKKIKMYALEILGKKIDEEEIKKEILSEIENRVEYEINKIKESERKSKLREYGLLFAQIEMMIFATLNRAWKGEERGSIRRHTNISEVIGNRPMGMKQEGGMFKWMKG